MSRLFEIQQTKSEHAQDKSTFTQSNLKLLEIFIPFRIFFSWIYEHLRMVENHFPLIKIFGIEKCLHTKINRRTVFIWACDSILNTKLLSSILDIKHISIYSFHFLSLSPIVWIYLDINCRFFWHSLISLLVFPFILIFILSIISHRKTEWLKGTCDAENKCSIPYTWYFFFQFTSNMPWSVHKFKISPT